MARSSASAVGNLGARILFEPGRVFVGNAGILVSRRGLREAGARAKTFVILDAAMNDLIRPTLYEAYHDIWPVRSPRPTRRRWSPMWSAGLRDRRLPRARPALPPLQAGDLVAIMTAGAYGAVQASTYNSRPLVPEVLVTGRRLAVVAAAARLRRP